MHFILSYDNIPAELRSEYRLSGWTSRVEGVNTFETNVRRKVNGSNVWVYPNEVPPEWVRSE